MAIHKNYPHVKATVATVFLLNVLSVNQQKTPAYQQAAVLASPAGDVSASLTLVTGDVSPAFTSVKQKGAT